MKRYLFIVNEVAGGGRAKASIPIIHNYLQDKNYIYDIKTTTCPKDGTKLVRDNIDEYDVFVAVGGDGTINEVAQGILLERKGILGIIPGGTGNDLAKDLGLPLNIEENISRILNGQVSKLDIARANNQFFLNIASIGYDAQVIRNHKKFKKNFRGKMVYLLSVIYTLFKFKPIEGEIILDEGYSLKGKLTLLAIGNGKYYGGGFKILPEADLNDRNLHICRVKKLARPAIGLLFPTVLFGNHIKITRYVDIYSSKTARIKLKDKTELNLDGEISERTKDITISLEDYEVNLIC